MKLSYHLTLSLFLFFSLAFGTEALRAQQNLLVINSSVGTNLTVCLNQIPFQLQVENPSPFNILNDTVTMTLPTGVYYQPGSIAGGIEVDISDLQQPVFQIPNINSLSSHNFSVTLEAGCEIRDFLSSGGQLVNTVLFEFDATNGIGVATPGSQTLNSAVYSVSIPSLALTTVTNQSYNASVGDVFSRCITIVNGGNGALDEFYFKDEHGAGISINAVSAGTLTPVPNGLLMHFTAADFMTLGDGDGLFEPGENITFCETVQVVACADVSSDFYYYWGCGQDTCEIQADGANVNFPGEVPNLTFTTFNSFTGSVLNANCYGNNASGDFESGFNISNAGTGTAYNVDIELYQHANGGNYTSDYYSSLNTGSFTYQVNGGPVLPLTLTATSNSVAKPCLPPNPKGRVYFTIDSILPGDVVTIRWNHFTCCYNNLCTNTERKHLLGWQFRGTYENRCYTPYTIPLVSSPAGVSYFRNTLIVDNSPGTMTGSSTETISFLFSNFETVLPRNTANDLFYYEVALPPCLTVVPGSFRILNAAGNQLANPDSMVTNGNLVRFYYSGPVGGEQAQLLFDISLDCNSCASTGVQNISLSSVYIPDRNCGCAINLGCVTTSIEILCPALCEGANLTTVNCQRVNYGLPDNDNNGLPDPGGAIDFSKVKTTRLMYGDTLGVEQVAYIHNPNGLNWGHIIAVSNIEGTGNIFTYGSGTLRIYDGATGNYYSCNAPSALTTTNIPGGVRYAHDINVNALAGGCLPAGYTLKTGDSVFWKMNYVVTSNIGGASLNGNSVNYMYTSAVPYVQPVDSNDLYGCNKVVRTFTVIGYYYTNYGPDSYDINNCNQFTISQNYYLSIGICCNNYGGGNLFPFEYRHWASPSMLRVVMPDDYTYIRARFNFVRTAGTLVTSSSPWFNINPSAVVGNTYDFDVSGYFGSTAADSILFGDDGFHGTLQVTFEPNCNVADSTGYIGYYWTFDESAQLQPSPTSPTSNVLTNDDITYNSPLVSLQSNLLSVNTSTGNVNWTLTMTNQSNVSTGSNLWIGYSSNGNIVADSILVNGTGQMLYPGPGNIFNLQQIGPAVTHTYTLYTHSTSCTTDSIMIYFGWGCTGIPTNLAGYECPVTPLKLTITPLFPALENSISILTADTIPLCDTTEYEILVRDFQLGNAYNILTQILLPNGLTLVPGSSQFQYNGAFVPVADPVLLGGTTWQWSINGMSQVLAGNGLAGIYDPQSNSFRIRFRAFATCNFISGERVRVQSMGEAFCGLGVSSIPVFSAPLLVQDALPPYQADIRLKMDFITPCTGGSQLLIRVLNLGTQPFDMFDSLRLSLTNGLTFIPGSQVPIHNAPAGAPLITSPNGFQELIWHLPQGVVTGDSSVFSVMLDADPSLLECGIVQISASSTASGFANCSQNGASCNISVVTGDTLRNIFIYKGYLQLSNSSGVSVPAPPAGESATVSFDIFNSGETIIAGTNTVISYYGDADGNGIFSAGDVPIGVHTITDQLGSNSTFSYTHTLPVNSPYTCGIIAVVDTSANPCICATQQIYIPIQLHSPPLQYQVCSGNTINIGNPAINNYTYNWNNAGYLNSATAAQPDFLHNTAYPVTDTLVFVRQIQKPGCAASDTVVVIVFPEPVPQAGADISLCNSYNTLLPAVAPQGTATGVWTLNGNFANPSGLNFADSTLFNTSAGGLQEGTYQLIWSLNSGPCVPRSDTMQIFVYDQPVSNAGADISLCNIYNTLLSGNAPLGTATGLWTLDGGFANPSGVTFSDSTLFNADASALQEGAYQLIWTLSNGTCVPSSDTMQVFVYDQPISNAGADIPLCNIYNTLLSGNAPVGTATGLWTLDGGFANPSGVTFSDSTLFNADASGLQEGAYQLIWTLSNGTCVPSSDTMQVFVYDQPVSNAGADIPLCNMYNTLLSGNAPVGTATGLWTLDGGFANPSGVTFSEDTLFNTDASGLQEGTYQLIWTLSNGTCVPSSDTMQVFVYDQPVSNAGADIPLCNIYNTLLSGNAPLGTATGLWTLDGGFANPSGVTFSDSTLFNTDANGLQEGTYQLIWTLSNGTCVPSSDTMQVLVYDQPVSNAGADIPLCNIYNTLLSGNAPLGTATGLWTLDGGFANPSGVTFSDDTLFNTDASGLQEGTYQLIWTLSNGTCVPSSDTMQVLVYDQPLSNAGADIPLCNIYNTLLSGNAPLGTATGLWTLDGGFANPSGVTFSDSTLFNADASGLQEGTYQLIWTLSNGTCVPSSDTMQVFVYDQPLSNAGADIPLCNIYNTLLSGNAPVGTATGLWTLDGGFANPSGVTFSDSTLFNADASGLQEGTYQLIWTLSNGTCVPSSDTMQVFVYDQPISNAGVDIFLCDSPLATLAANMPQGTAQGVWSVISGPGVPVFADINLYNTGISALVLGNYAYVWTLTNGTCPPAADTMILYNQPLPDAISSYVTEICDEQCMKLTSLSTAPPNETLTAWEWYINGNMVSDDQTFEYCFTQEGVYSVLLITQASNGCRDSSDFNPPVTVRPLPQAGFSTKPAGSAPVMEPVHIYDESSPDVVSYLYTSGNGNSSAAPSPQFFYTSFGTYYITQWVTNSYTCRDSLTKPIDIREVSNAYIPNAFTPGSNGINDEWRPVISNATTYSLYIFDRWGELIFVSNDPYKGWNGGFRNDVSNPVQMGMYVYKVEYIDFDGKEKSLYGHINLLR